MKNFKLLDLVFFAGMLVVGATEVSALQPQDNAVSISHTELWNRFDDQPHDDKSRYFKVSVASMRLAKTNGFLSRYYPGVKAEFKFRNYDSGIVTVNAFTAPSGEAREVRGAQERLKEFNVRLMEWTPYEPGDFSIETLLMQVKVKDFAPALIGVVKSVTGLAGLSMGPIDKYSDVVSTAMTALGQNKNVKFITGYKNGDWPKGPRSGYFAVLWNPQSEYATFDKNRLSISFDGPNDPYLSYEGEEITKVAWMLIRIETAEFHNMWKTSPAFIDISRSFNDAELKIDDMTASTPADEREKLINGMFEALENLKSAVRADHSLIQTHKKEISRSYQALVCGSIYRRSSSEQYEKIAACKGIPNQMLLLAPSEGQRLLDMDTRQLLSLAKRF